MRRLALAALALLISLPAFGEELAVLPLRVRGIAPLEERRLEGKVLAGFRAARGEILPPEGIPERLKRDERRRMALEEAHRDVADSAARYRELDSAGALERVERALTLYREHLGEWADPPGFADAYLWRGAQRLSDRAMLEARSDFLMAALLAPTEVPTLEDFPPAVVEAYETARGDRGKRVLAPDEPARLAQLASALGVPALVEVRVERQPEGINLEMGLWSIPIGGAPTRTGQVLLSPLLEPDLERAQMEAERLVGPARPVVAIHPTEIHPDPARITRPPPPRPIHAPVAGVEPPLWKNPWLWAGVGGVLVVGAGATYLINQQQPSGTNGFTVTLRPGG